MTSYPLTIPSTIKPNRVEWYMGNVVAVSQSPFSLKAQVQRHTGDLWAVEVSYPLMTRSEAAPYFAFLGLCLGRYGTFRFGDTLLASPQGTMAGTPKIRASSSGNCLYSKGWTVGATLKAGDFVTVDSSLYMVLADVTADGSGNCDFEVWPTTRGHAVDTVIVTTNCTCLMRLTNNIICPVSAETEQLYSIGFSAQEAR